MSIVSEISRINENIANSYTAIDDMGGTLPQVRNSANLESAIRSIPSGGEVKKAELNDVNFYDYDGTIIDSYSASDFLTLSALPNNPSHTGLTAQGWNWSLADAQNYVTNYGKLNIGQMYTTDDNKTRLYIHLESGRTSPALGFAVNGSVTVDWGDNTSEVVTGTSTSTVINTEHNYTNAGDYIITLDSSSTIYLIGDNSQGSYLLRKVNLSINESKVYQNCLKKIELGSNVSIGNYAFYNCYSLSSITIPNNITSIGTYTFYYCYSLSSITIPNNITSIENYTFYYCVSLSNINMPKSVTDIGDYAFYYCYSLPNIIIADGVTKINNRAFYNCFSLSNIIIPNSVNDMGTYVFYNCYSLSSIIMPNRIYTIGAYVFYNCFGMGYYDFTNRTSIPSLANKSAFQNISSDCQIIVPDELYDNWITRTNWSEYANNIVKASEVNV